MNTTESAHTIDDADTTPETWGFAHEDPGLIVDANHLPVGRAAHPGSLDAHKLAAAGQMFDLLSILIHGEGPSYVAAIDEARELLSAVETLNYG